MLPFLKPEQHRPLLVGTVKAAVAIGLLSFAASHWLSRQAFDQQGLARLVAGLTGGQSDPMSTGSIGERAQAAKIDPCAVPARR